MDHIVEPERKIPIFSNVDVLVVGGGPAGSAAGIFAARMGVKTRFSRMRLQVRRYITASPIGASCPGILRGC